LTLPAAQTITGNTLDLTKVCLALWRELDATYEAIRLRHVLVDVIVGEKPLEVQVLWIGVGHATFQFDCLVYAREMSLLLVRAAQRCVEHIQRLL